MDMEIIYSHKHTDTHTHTHTHKQEVRARIGLHIYTYIDVQTYTSVQQSGVLWGTFIHGWERITCLTEISRGLLSSVW
jgi:hypothetical protein